MNGNDKFSEYSNDDTDDDGNDDGNDDEFFDVFEDYSHPAFDCIDKYHFFLIDVYRFRYIQM